MKNVTAALFFVLSVFSATAFAMVVSDPTSYTYYVEQLKAMEKQMQSMEKTFAMAEKTHNRLADGDIKSVVEVKDALSGNYNRAAEIQMELTEYNTRVGNPAPAVGEKDSMQWEGEKYLKERFKAPGEAGSTQGNRRASQEARDFTYQQAITAASVSLESLKDRIRVQKELASQIDKTENLKDATDLSNRMLLELLTIQTEMLAAINYMSAAVAVSEYQGTNNRAAREQKSGGNFKTYLKEVNGGQPREFGNYGNRSSEW